MLLRMAFIQKGMCLVYLCGVSLGQEIIKFGVVLPFGGDMDWSLPRVKGAITCAIDTIHSRNDLLPGRTIQVNYGDSGCSETIGPITAIDMFYHDQAHVFFGPVCDYALASVARFSPHWNIPVITAGGLVSAFSDKKGQFRQLTRICGSYSDLGRAASAILSHFYWSRVGLLYNEYQGRRSTRGKTNCWFIMEAMYYQLLKNLGETHPGEDIWYKAFDEEAEPDENLDNIASIIDEAKQTTRIVVLCASSDSVREIMIKAAEMGLDNGEYVFLNIDLFNRKIQMERPWYRELDTKERNELALRAYEALMTITLREPKNDKYRQFSEEVKRRTREEYGDSVYEDEELVNGFVAAFHDGVILYAHALNESMEAGFNATNGLEVTKRMWNRTIDGVLGDVTIDSNGDRKADYSLLDFNPATQKFEVIGSYFGNIAEYEPEVGKVVHWPGGRTDPPTDTPACGFDGSGCPVDEPFPKYAIMIAILVLGSILLIVVLVSLFICRHYRLQATQAAAHWRVKWDGNMFGTNEKRKLDGNEEDNNVCMDESRNDNRYKPLDESEQGRLTSLASSQHTVDTGIDEI